MEEEPRTVRIRVDLSYDGSGFSGWAAQPGRRTVEGELAAALGRVLRLPGPPKLTVAGRTDAGVHARGQVIHADVPAVAWAAADGRAAARLAGVLPADIRVRAADQAPAGFDARFSALWRRYSYRVCDDPATADPLRRHETLWYFRRLDLTAMNEAALSCLGEHDFAAFCRRREGATTIRSLRTLGWHRDHDGIAIATVVADAFCHNMVRLWSVRSSPSARDASPAAAGRGARRRGPRSRGPGHGAARAVPGGSWLSPGGRSGGPGRRHAQAALCWLLASGSP